MSFDSDELQADITYKALDALEDGRQTVKYGCLRAVVMILAFLMCGLSLFFAIRARADGFAESVWVEIFTGSAFFLAAPIVLARAGRPGIWFEIGMGVAAIAIGVVAAFTSGLLQSLLLGGAANMLLLLSLDYFLNVHVFGRLDAAAKEARTRLRNNKFMEYLKWEEEQAARRRKENEERKQREMTQQPKP